MPLPVVIPGYEILESWAGEEWGRLQVSPAGLNRLVALKMLLQGAFAAEEGRARFRVEAEAVARLQHPHIVRIYEVGEHEGQLFCALELVEGGSLEKLLAGKPLPSRPAAALAETLARAVHFAHQHQIVHRDLKPANVLLQMADSRFPIENQESGPPSNSASANLQSAIPKITDFGLAKLLDEGSGQTRTGDLLGTPSYMARSRPRGTSARSERPPTFTRWGRSSTRC